MLAVTGSPTWRTVIGGSADLRGAGRQAAGRGAHRHPGAVRPAAGRRGRASPPGTARSGSSTRWCWPPTPTRRCGCWRTRRPTSAGCWARSATPATRRCCTPTPRCCRAARGARASWNYRMPSCDAPAAEVRVSYDMNRLQRLETPEHYVVTLNADDAVDESRVVSRMVYEHPVYTPESVAAQQPAAGAGHRRHRLRRRLPRLGLPRGRLPVGGPGGGRAGGEVVNAARTPTGAPTDVPALYDCVVTHVRTAPVRHAFRHRTYLWLVDLDRTAAAAAAAAAVGPVRRRGPLRGDGADHPGRARPLPGGPRGRPDRRPGPDAGPRPGPRPRLQPDHRLLVPRPARRAGVRGRRGPQHLRRTPLLPAAPRRGRPGRGRQGVLRLAVLPGRRRLPDAAAGAGRAARPDDAAAARGGDAVHRGPARRAAAGHPRRGCCAAAVRRPWSTAAVSLGIRQQGVRLFLRGLPVRPRPHHRVQEGLK